MLSIIHDPANKDVDLDRNFENQIYKTIRQHCKSGPDEAIRQFCAFRGGDGIFYEATCWDYVNDPKMFWLMQVSGNNVIY